MLNISLVGQDSTLWKLLLTLWSVDHRNNLFIWRVILNIWINILCLQFVYLSCVGGMSGGVLIISITCWDGINERIKFAESSKKIWILFCSGQAEAVLAEWCDPGGHPGHEMSAGWVSVQADESWRCEVTIPAVTWWPPSQKWSCVMCDGGRGLSHAWQINILSQSTSTTPICHSFHIVSRLRVWSLDPSS